MNILSQDLSHEKMINVIIFSHYRQSPKSIRRITIGICNEVYEVGLNDPVVIARLNPCDRFLMRSHDHIPKLDDKLRLNKR